MAVIIVALIFQALQLVKFGFVVVYFLDLFVHVYGYCAFACVHVPHEYPQRSELHIRFPGTRVMDSCELPCGCWEPNTVCLIL